MPAATRSSATIIEQVLDALEAQGLPMFGLHRRRLSQPTPYQKGRIAAIWDRAGIATAAEADYYLTPVST